MNTKRLNVILEKLDAMGVPQMLITDPMSIFYLTGRFVNPGERLFALYISKSGRNKIFINDLFTVPEDLGVEKVWFSDMDDSISLLHDAIDHQAPLGIDKVMAARFLLPLMEKNSAAKFLNTSICVDEARAVKDGEEIRLMRESSIINDQAMALVKELIKDGVTEREISDKIGAIYKKLGSDEFSFAPLVGFGANCARGHYEAGDVAIKPGDCVLVDMGCKKGGYCSDMTRTFFFKTVKGRHRFLYEKVLEAVRTAEAMVKPGVPLCDIDQAARKVLTDAGCEGIFTTRLGHFIGLEDHDYGDVSRNNKSVAVAGNIFSIEPGVYIMGEVGIRIEDLVLVTEDGCEILNSYTKELQVVG